MIQKSRYHSMWLIPDDGRPIYDESDSFDLAINGINTWYQWHLIPTSRPVFNPPAPKATLIDLPGANGSIDATEALSPYPVYDNRSGSIEFYVMNGTGEENFDICPDNDDGSSHLIRNPYQSYGEWEIRYSEIANYLHGRRFKIVLEDDPTYFYLGRLSINAWKTDKNWSKITFDYKVDPFKYLTRATNEPWLWDPFNFETGIISYIGRIILDASSSSSSADVIVPIVPTYSPVLPVFVVKCDNWSSGGPARTIIIEKWRGDSSNPDRQHDTVEVGKTIIAKDNNYNTYSYYDFNLSYVNETSNLSAFGDHSSDTYLFISCGAGSKFQVGVEYRGGSL